MDYERWGSFSVRADVASLVDGYADRASVPRNVLRAAVLAESGGDPEALNTDDNGYGASVGLLQLNDFGQGSGMTIEERQDPRRNLEVGVPFIRDAWVKTAKYAGRLRVERTMALSGHPSDPERLTGNGRSLAEFAIRRIADIWEDLEAATPTTPAADWAGFVPILNGERVRDAIDESTAWAREHPGAALIAGVAIVASLLLV